MAQPFDLRKLDLAGEPVPVAERVSDSAGFAASRTGVLVYRAGAAVSGDVQLTLFDRQGKVLGPVGEPAQYGGPTWRSHLTGPAWLLPAGTDNPAATNIWITDLTRGVSARFTSGRGELRLLYGRQTETKSRLRPLRRIGYRSICI